MKTAVYLLFITLISTSAMAQFNRHTRDLNRMNQYQNPSPQKEKQMDPLESSLNFLTDELNLDTFQAAAIKVFLEDTQTENNKIAAMNISQAEKNKKMEENKEKLDANIIKLLNDEQKQKFEIIKDNPDKKGKSTKKKKKKKSESASE